MRSVIGNNLITSLKPRERPYEVRDTRLKGLLLRVQPSGLMTFYVEYARGKRSKLGRADAMSPAQARSQAKKILGVALQGGDPSAKRRQAHSHTFASFVDEAYGPWARENIRWADATIRRLHVCFPDFQDKKLSEITPWLVEKWRMARLKSGTKPTTVNRDLGDLKSSLAKAVQWGLIDVHPISSVKRSRVDTSPSIRFLSRDEEDRLRHALTAREARIFDERDRANGWRAARGYPLLPDLRERGFADHLLPMVIVSLNTGMRRGELFDLTWFGVDLDRALITVHGAHAKSGRTRHIPLNQEARVVLRSWRPLHASAETLVFPGRQGRRLDNVQTSWKSVVKKAAIERFRWHDLRHTFASRLVMAGVDLNTVRELLGHSTYQMTLRYAHLAPEHKAAAVAKLDAPQPTSGQVREIG